MKTLLLAALLIIPACTDAPDPGLGAQHLIIFGGSRSEDLKDLRVGQHLDLCLWYYDPNESGLAATSNPFYLNDGKRAFTPDPEIVSFTPEGSAAQCLDTKLLLQGITTLAIQNADGTEIDHIELVVH